MQLNKTVGFIAEIKQVLAQASQKAYYAVNTAFGKGFSITNLHNFRKFYFLFSHLEIQQTAAVVSTRQIQQTVSVKSKDEKEELIAEIIRENLII